jgi:hypothetical protein
MRRFGARLFLLLLIALILSPGRAEAVSSRDIIELARAGLGEAVLLALVEVDGGVFTIDKATLTELKAAGVSERVIEAMIRSGRQQPAMALKSDPEPNPAPPPPQVIVVESQPSVVQQVAVPVPVYVPFVTNTRVRHHSTQQNLEVFRGFGFGLPSSIHAPQPPKRVEPVYWGWGGKLRPDAWKPK